MPQQINLEADASFRFQTTLNDQTVYISMLWQPTTATWIFSMEHDDGTSIIQGRRMVTNQNVLDGVLADPFTGKLVPVSINPPVGELQRDSWVTTHMLTYYAEGESVPDLP
jgi:hypothetical protein